MHCTKKKPRGLFTGGFHWRLPGWLYHRLRRYFDDDRLAGMVNGP
jgi:hypothetical protein